MGERKGEVRPEGGANEGRREGDRERPLPIVQNVLVKLFKY